MAGGKDTTTYWLRRVSTRGLKSPDLHARISYGGKQRWVNLGASQKKEAAKRAVAFLKQLQETDGDWLVARRSIGQATRSKPGTLTVGSWIQAFSECAEISVDPRTVMMYAQCLRRIAAYVGKVTHEKYPARKDWRSAADAVSLSLLTPEAIRGYMTAKLRGVRREQLDRARRGLHTDLRNARNLFAAKRLQALAHLGLVVVPFSETKIEPHKPKRHKSSVNVPLILKAARSELDQPQQIALILFACCGLRKEEADKLLWSQVKLGGDHPHVEIKETWCYKPKSASSARVVPIAPEVAQFLAASHDPEQEFVLAGTHPQLGVTYFHYRARAAFERLGPWLRSKGVEAPQPLHTFRKEFGSVINRKAGLHAAMEALGHSDISVTSSTYVEYRERVVVGLD